MKIRQLSLSDKIALFFSELYGFVGLFFFLFSLFFFSFFTSKENLTDLKFSLHNNLEHTTGYVEDVNKTNGNINEQPIMAISYTFSVEGQTYRKVAFSESKHYQSSQSVKVEYIPNQPETARITGTRNAKFPVLVTLFIFVFTAVGGSLMFLSIRAVVKKTRILLNGRMSHGTLLEKQSTMASVNKKRVYKLTFEFEVDGKKFTNVTRTTHPYILENEEEEKLIYNRLDPTESVMMDLLPGRFQSWFKTPVIS